ncbi:MAG: type II toxin-antitoxin system RelE/ParE family toxin [Acidobacteriota bacterium]
MLKLVIHPEAEEELNAAADYYEKCKDGLGISFLHEIEKGFQQIQDNPLIGNEISTDIRRYLLRRFPYGIMYRVEINTIFILAIAHLHREPGYWKKRN